jgi:dCTP deaminase
VITDHGTEFDRVREGYKGPLYAEISPRSFSILARTGSSLVQLRIRRGSPAFSDTALRRLHDEVGLFELRPGENPAREAIRDGLAFSVDVAGDRDSGIVGYKARRHTDLVDVDRVHYYDPRDFWEPVYAHRGPGPAGGIVLDPHDFYILASREAVVVPPDHAAEMLPYHTFVGEFRVHFAGFFDPGFGTSETGGAGSRAVLEVRSHEVPFLIEDGQVLGRLVYERLIARPDKLYVVPSGRPTRARAWRCRGTSRNFPRGNDWCRREGAQWSSPRARGRAAVVPQIGGSCRRDIQIWGSLNKRTAEQRLTR